MHIFKPENLKLCLIKALIKQIADFQQQMTSCISKWVLWRVFPVLGEVNLKVTYF